MSQEIIGCEKINLDDYEIKKVLWRGRFGYAVLAIDQKTKKEVRIQAYIPTANEKVCQNVISSINISNSFAPFLVKTLGYRPKLSDTEIQNSNNSERLKDDSGEEHFVDFSGFLVVTEYYKYPTLDILTKEYLESNGEKPEIMNPTVRSKIIFGVSSFMERLHSKNIIYRDFKQRDVLLNDDLEPVFYGYELPVNDSDSDAPRVGSILNLSMVKMKFIHSKLMFSLLQSFCIKCL